MNKKPDSRSLASKSWISESFFQLLTQQTFESITIKKITEKAGVSRQTFYAHYTQKEDILNEYLDTLFHEIRCNISGYTTLDEMSPFLVTYLKTQEDRLRILFTSNLDQLLIYKLEVFLSTVFPPKPISEDLPLSSVRDNDLITFLASGCFYAGKKIISSKDEIALDHYLQVLFSIINTVLAA